MKAFILQGNCDTGKTETIQRLIYEFWEKSKENKKFEINIEPLPKYGKAFEELVEKGLVRNPSGSMKDFQVVVEEKKVQML